MQNSNKRRAKFAKKWWYIKQRLVELKEELKVKQIL